MEQVQNEMINNVQQQQGNSIAIDLNLGTGCNFRCKYCFEQGCYTDKAISRDVVDRFVYLVDEMTAVDTNVSICFWGGEPMMYMDTINYVMDKLGRNPLVSFFLYTNGWFIKQHEKTLDDFISTCGKRFTLQISHDFMPGDMNKRVMLNKSSDEVTHRVLDALRWCDEREMNFSAKSTLMIDDLEHNLFTQYMTFNDFRKTLKHHDTFFLAITPDTDNTRAADEQALGEQLKKLLVYFANNKMKKTYFHWFDDAHRAVCAGGATTFIVDVDGTVYPCHRCLYGWGENHDRANTGYTSVFDDNVLYKIEHNVIARNHLSRENEQCAACDTLVCFRCNATNCKGDLMNWNKSNPDVQCNMYKFISKYIAAYQKMRSEW